MNQDNNHIIELSMDDMLVERQPSRLPKRLLIASGVLVAAAFVLLTLYFSLLNKEKYPVNVLFDTLCANYCLPEDISEEYKLKILTIWQASRMNT
ncbi:MAG: hypothetical protein J5531_07760, partial [Lachnospiraceae bacterium]|nr:hypothetical protein [Lachnospiraceae bacterium]